jgi:hypothetical protein
MISNSVPKELTKKKNFCQKFYKRNPPLITLDYLVRDEDLKLLLMVSVPPDERPIVRYLTAPKGSGK